MKTIRISILLSVVGVLFLIACEDEFWYTPQQSTYYDDKFDDEPQLEHLFYIGHTDLRSYEGGKNHLIRTYSVEQGAFIDSFDPGFEASFLVDEYHKRMILHKRGLHQLLDLNTKSVIKELPVVNGHFALSYNGLYYAIMSTSKTFILKLPEADTVFETINRLTGEAPRGDFDKDDKIFYWSDTTGFIRRYNLISHKELEPYRIYFKRSTWPGVLKPLRNGTIYLSLANNIVQINKESDSAEVIYQYSIFAYPFAVINNEETEMYFVLQNHPGEWRIDTIYTVDLVTNQISNKLSIGDIYGYQYFSDLALTHDGKYLMVGADIFGYFWATLVDVQRKEAIAKIVMDSLQFPNIIETQR